MSQFKGKSDVFWWILIVGLASSAIFANYYFKDLLWALRFSVGIVLSGGLFGLISLTSQGRRFLSFFKEAKIELTKVVWPTRDEAVKTTGVVAVLVFVMSIILWGVDTVLLWVVSWITK
jgi:preprotein translocase subunit SecE